MSEPLCPHCKRQYPIGWTKAWQARKSANIKAALAKADRVGRKRTFDHSEIVRLRREGMTLDAIAKVMNCTRSTVQYAIKLEGRP